MGQGKVGNERRAMGSLRSVDGACVCVFCHGGRASRSERAQRGNWMEGGGVKAWEHFTLIGGRGGIGKASHRARTWIFSVGLPIPSDQGIPVRR